MAEWDGKPGFNATAACRMLWESKLGKLWSLFSWCLVPVAESDLGCGDGMLGGAQVLQRTKLDPVGEIVK